MTASTTDQFGTREVRVETVNPEADRVLSLRLVDPTGAELPPWTPGAHLDVVLPSGLIRQYSLCGDPADRSVYQVAVLRELDGRGGSAEIHDTPLVGRTLSIRGPRNHFDLVDAPSYLFLAGGIGITPILAMIREVSGRGVPWRLVYGGRTTASMAYLDVLQAFPGGVVEVVPQDERGLPDLANEISGAPEGAAVYCCGPEGLIHAVEELCAVLMPPGRLHVERFGAGTPLVSAESAEVGGQIDTAFEVELRSSNITLQIPADRGLLAVIRDVIPDVPFSCEEGYCGTCETPVLEGIPDHRDTILSEEEQAANDTMMICVGRCKSGRLVLDL